MEEITLDDVFDKQNLDEALEVLSHKRDTCGTDGVMLSELGDYWRMNGLRIMAAIREKKYEPGMVRMVEIVNYKGKKRMISIYPSVDRLILRAILQVVEPIIDEMLLPCCFAFREGYGLTAAVEQARDYIENGDKWVAQADVKDYYDSIPIAGAEKLMNNIFSDDGLRNLMSLYLHPTVEDNGKIYKKQKGILQGSPISPVIANLYLTDLDAQMMEEEYHYCRYADDINIYCRTSDDAETAFARLKECIELSCGLSIKPSKSGVFASMNTQYLGYQFTRDRKSRRIIAVRARKEKPSRYLSWHRDCVQKVDRNYHIVNDGILTKRDFTILFENKNGKKYLPIETTQGLSIYSNVTFSSDFFRFIRNRKISVALFDKYGNFVGEFISESCHNNGKTMLKQAELYLDNDRRLAMAKSVENACAHNVRANLKYYQKRIGSSELGKCIDEFKTIMDKINGAKNIEELMLVEARYRQMYYAQFNLIIKDDRFKFTQRSRRPPKDPLNALISFGNTYLYNRLASKIHRTSLDIRIGIVHSTNNRSQTLNLDLADLFKPVIVDRVIFTLINKHMLNVDRDFKEVEGGGVYLTKSGKRLFVGALDEKVYSKISLGGQELTYDAVMTAEIYKLYNAIVQDKKYKPYKYY